jgi:hypothetical protein
MEQRRRFWKHGNGEYLNVDSLAALHQLLRVQELHGSDFQAFVDLLQRVGEERQLMDLNDEQQDDWVPLAVVRDFVSSTYHGMASLMRDICPLNEAMPTTAQAVL